MEIASIPTVDILGGAVLGNLLTALCSSILTIQTFIYYPSFPNDGRPVKLAVAVLWALEAFQLASGTRSLYWRFVTNYRNPLVVQRAPWNLAIYIINIACPSVIAQTFFAYRIYSLSANLYAGMLVQVFVLLQFGFGVANAIKAIRMLELQVIVKEGVWLVIPWLTLQAIADVVIATSMCLLLRHRRTGFQKTDSVINRMVLYTISTGLVTSVLSCISLVLFAKYGIGFGVLIIGMPLGGFYSIIMLANLHIRTRLRARLDTPSPLELLACSIKKRMLRNAGDRGSVRYNEEKSQATRINITREVACNDVDIDLMTHDTEVWLTVVQSPVSGGT